MKQGSEIALRRRGGRGVNEFLIKRFSKLCQRYASIVNTSSQETRNNQKGKVEDGDMEIPAICCGGSYVEEPTTVSRGGLARLAHLLSTLLAALLLLPLFTQGMCAEGRLPRQVHYSGKIGSKICVKSFRRINQEEPGKWPPLGLCASVATGSPW